MSKIVFSDKQASIVRHNINETLLVCEGTPRSGKTTSLHFRYARFLIESRDESHLVVAYNQEQAYRLMLEGDGTGLINIFGNNARLRSSKEGDYLQIQTPNGVKKVFYKGGGKKSDTKAITGMSLGSVAFMEINLLHMDMVQECFRRTYAAVDRWHIADLNPPSPHHPVIKDVFEVQETHWVHWTPNDNPILTEKRKEEIRTTLMKSPYLYARDWEGKRLLPQGLVYGSFSHDVNVTQRMIGEPYEMFFEADGGQSDATSCSCNIVTLVGDKFRMYRVAHYYHSGADTGEVKAMSQYAREIKQFIDWCMREFQMPYEHFGVDPACKSLREELHAIGVMTDKSNNNSHDVSGGKKGAEVGIERVNNVMANEQFFILERNQDRYDHYNFFKEIEMYSRDNNGVPIDDYDHAMDELRYATNYFYVRYVL